MNEEEVTITKCFARYVASGQSTTGVLSLTNMRILFEEDTGKPIPIPLKQISCCIPNKRTDSNVLLKIVKKGQNPKSEGFTFLFTTPDGSFNKNKEELLEQREIFSETLKDLVKQSGRKRKSEGNEEIEEENKRLKLELQRDSLSPQIPKKQLSTSKIPHALLNTISSDPDLKYLYSELVPSVFTWEEFCSQRKELSPYLHTSSNENNNNNNDNIGNNNKNKNNNGKDDQVHYRITPTIIQRIYEEFPEVKKNHDRLVPSKKSEEAFWTDYFQALYFHRSSKNSMSSDDILRSAYVDDLNLGNIGAIDPLLDLTKEQETNLNEMNLNLKNVDMIKKLNSYGTIEVNTNPIDKLFNHSRLTKKVTSVKDQIIIEDLQEDISALPFTHLKISDPRNFFDEEESKQSLLDHYQVTQKDVDTFVSGVSSWEPSEHSFVVSPAEFSPKVLFKLFPTDTNNEFEPTEFLISLRKFYMKSYELLRHFWACYPITSHDSALKVKHLAKAIEVLFKEIFSRKQFYSNCNDVEKAKSLTFLLQNLQFAVTQAKSLLSSSSTS